MRCHLQYQNRLRVGWFTYPPKQLSLHSLLAPAAPKRSRSPPPLRLGGLLPPPPKARPLSLQPQRASPKALSQQMPPIAIHSPAAPLREPRLYPPRPRQVKNLQNSPVIGYFVSSSVVHTGQLLLRLGAASLLLQSLLPSKDSAQHLLAGHPQVCPRDPGEVPSHRSTVHGLPRQLGHPFVRAGYASHTA